jgi:hypothetical protein
MRKVTSDELLPKEAVRKKMHYVQNNRYIFKLLFSIVTAGIEALVSAISFVCMCQRSLLPVSSAMF